MHFSNLYKIPQGCRQANRQAQGTDLPLLHLILLVLFKRKHLMKTIKKCQSDFFYLNVRKKTSRYLKDWRVSINIFPNLQLRDRVFVFSGHSKFRPWNFFEYFNSLWYKGEKLFGVWAKTSHGLWLILLLSVVCPMKQVVNKSCY